MQTPPWVEEDGGCVRGARTGPRTHTTLRFWECRVSRFRVRTLRLELGGGGGGLCVGRTDSREGPTDWKPEATSVQGPEVGHPKPPKGSDRDEDGVVLGAGERDRLTS